MIHLLLVAQTHYHQLFLEAFFALHNHSCRAFLSHLPPSVIILLTLTFSNFSRGGRRDSSSVSVNSSYLREHRHFYNVEKWSHSHVNRCFLLRCGTVNWERDMQISLITGSEGITWRCTFCESSLIRVTLYILVTSFIRSRSDFRMCNIINHSIPWNRLVLVFIMWCYIRNISVL